MPLGWESERIYFTPEFIDREGARINLRED